MATNTENLGVIKPAAEDFYNIENFNENFQKIDDFVGGRGYYIGNVDELKTAGTYIIVIGNNDIKMSGTFPLDDLSWYTVNVFGGGTGSIVQDWVSATEPPRRFIRHFDGIRWGSYTEIANVENPTFHGDVTFVKTGNGKTTLCKQNTSDADYGTELTDHTANGTKTKFIIRSNIDLKNAVGFSSTITGLFYKLFGEHNTPIIPIESTDYPGCFYRMVNGKKEWINPPNAKGILYPTMERFEGKVVFVLHSDFVSSGERFTIYPDFETMPKIISVSGTYSYMDNSIIDPLTDDVRIMCIDNGNDGYKLIISSKTSRDEALEGYIQIKFTLD